MVITMLYERYRRAREMKASVLKDVNAKTSVENMVVAAEAEAWNALQSAKLIFYGPDENLPRDAEGAHTFVRIIGLRGLIKKRKAGNRKAR